MLGNLAQLATTLTMLIVLVLAVIFRKDLRKLVDWIVKFRRVSKTKEGYSL